MKRLLFVILTLIISYLIPHTAYAGQIEERHNFYALYDPTSVTFVYDGTGDTATGDEVAVNTYTRKTIQIAGNTVNEDTQIQIEGRSKENSDYAILDTVNFGSASADSAKHQVVDVTEHIDFLRIGIRNWGVTGTSAVTIDGIFTNLER